MTTAKEELERALEAYEQVTTLPASHGVDAFQDTTIEAVFGRVWTRPGLTRKERRWITLSVAAMTGSPVAVESHLRAALASGDISDEELLEWTIHFAHYAGWPLAANSYMVMRRVQAEIEAAQADTD